MALWKATYDHHHLGGFIAKGDDEFDAKEHSALALVLISR
jgi:hypothetical protein